MLDLAADTAGDIVYDLGYDDGRIVIAAGRRGARGLSVDIDDVLIQNAQVRRASGRCRRPCALYQGRSVQNRLTRGQGGDAVPVGTVELATMAQTQSPA